MKHAVKLWAFRAVSYPYLIIPLVLVLLYHLFNWLSDLALEAGEPLGDIEDRLKARRDFFRGTP